MTVIETTLREKHQALKDQSAYQQQKIDDYKEQVTVRLSCFEVELMETSFQLVTLEGEAAGYGLDLTKPPTTTDRFNIEIPETH